MKGFCNNAGPTAGAIYPSPVDKTTWPSEVVTTTGGDPFLESRLDFIIDCELDNLRIGLIGINGHNFWGAIL